MAIVYFIILRTGYEPDYFIIFKFINEAAPYNCPTYKGCEINPWMILETREIGNKYLGYD
jgi:hypothetical protein